MYIINIHGSWIENDSHDITYFNVINEFFDFNQLFDFLYLKLFTTV